MTNLLNFLRGEIVNDLSGIIQGREDSFAVLTTHLEEKTAQAYRDSFSKNNRLTASDVKPQKPSIFTKKKSKEALLEKLVKNESAEIAKKNFSKKEDMFAYVNERFDAIQKDPSYAQLTRTEIHLAITNAIYL